MARARSFPELARRVRVLCAALLALGLWPQPAWAQRAAAPPAPGGWALCNLTSYVIEAATGRPSGKAVLVRGWIRMRPGECWTAAAAPLAKGVHFLYARTSSAHRGGHLFWGGLSALCVDPVNSFSIQNPPNCENVNLEARQFRQVRINKRESWRTNLTEPQTYSLESAKAVGVQRLLLDSGIESRGRVGAMDGRQVANAIGRFRAEANLPANASQDQLIDALEAAAKRRAARLGLTLCNKTAGKIWSAIARRRGEGWESRGWWVIAPNACVRTIDDALLQNVYFVHATLISPQGERFLAAGGETFCTSPAKFAVIGREECEKRFYDSTIFTAISPQGLDGMRLEFSDRDFLPAGQEARHLEMPKVADAVKPLQEAPDRGRVGRTAPFVLDAPGRRTPATPPPQTP